LKFPTKVLCGLTVFYNYAGIIFDEIKRMGRWDEVNGSHFHKIVGKKSKGWSDPRKKKEDQQRKAENRRKPQPQNGKHISTTPIVKKVFGQYWEIGEEETETEKKSNFSIKSNPVELKGKIELNETNFLLKDSNEKSFYSQVKFGNAIVKLNDCVTLPINELLKNPKKKDLIFGIIVALYSQQNVVYCKIQKMIPGDETFIGDTGDPKEVRIFILNGLVVSHS
jgi:hypothetical protein